jgi:hypothetical protein
MDARVDYGTAVLAFDNMQKRGIKRTTEPNMKLCCMCPKKLHQFLMVFYRSGTGQIWFKDVNFEIVADSVPETGPNKGRDHKVISFEKRAKALLMKLRK